MIILSDWISKLNILDDFGMGKNVLCWIFLWNCVNNFVPNSYGI